MKKSVLIITVLLAKIVMAAPSIGDSTIHRVVAVGGEVYQLNQEVTSIDPTTDTLKYSYVWSKNGTTIDTGVAAIGLSDLISLDAFVDDCKITNAPAGTSATKEIVSIAAGTFESCHMTGPGGDMYYGHVPFVMLKFQDKGGSTELVSFVKK